MIKKRKTSMIVISLSLLLTFGLVGCSSQKNNVIKTVNGTKYTQEDIDKEAVANKKLGHILAVKTSDITLKNGKFIGTIQNTNTDVSVSNVTIDLGIYNSNNDKIGDEYIYIGQINCGETYQINQSFYSYKYKNADTFKLVNKEVNINE